MTTKGKGGWQALESNPETINPVSFFQILADFN